MLWIAIHLPELSLQLARHGIIPAAKPLYALGSWASQFTPNVVLEPSEVLLEVDSTLRLHGGLRRLLLRVRRGVAELGYEAALGVAPTPLAASIFARARQAGLRVRAGNDPASLSERLEDLPLALLNWPEELIASLRALGLRRIGQCLKLPRDSFIRRFGKQRRLELDRLVGAAPDPRPYFAPPVTFHGRVEFEFEVANVSILFFPLKRLLGELEGFLRGRGAGVQQWRLLLEHLKAERTCITMGTAAPERSARILLMLARERLGRTALRAPVLALEVVAEDLIGFDESNHCLLADPASRAFGWGQLIDRLNARLGSDKVHRLRALDDHRPEYASRCDDPAATGGAHVPNVQAPRPLWLLGSPRPLAREHGLRILAGPERIETGWWDGHGVCRDYYVARNVRGETFWIYRDGYDQHWYLHGAFS